MIIGILQKATDAKENTDNAQIKERIQLAYHSALTGGQGSYTKESLEEELEKEFGENNYNVDDSDNTNWILSAKGQDVTIPAGSAIVEEIFAPYDNPYIPTNFSHVGTENWNQGFTIKGDAGSANENDEFVWVPCVLEQSKVKPNDTVLTFGKTLPETNDNSDPYWRYNDCSMIVHPSGGINESVNAEDNSVLDIRNSVNKYGGFYIAKYEAGKEEENDKPLSQPNKDAWNQLTREEALTKSSTMISSNAGVKSALISGECWDTTLQWITTTADSTYATTVDTKGLYNSQTMQKTGYYGTNTNNIFDMGGNISEYTTENGTFYGVQCGVSRGGSCWHSSACAASRHYDGYKGYSTGFRVVIYKD